MKGQRERVVHGVYHSPFFHDFSHYISNTETVQLLLEHGADVAARSTWSTPLHLALSIKSPEIVRLLIKYGADVNALDGNRIMPLHLALVKVSVNTYESYHNTGPM